MLQIATKGNTQILKLLRASFDYALIVMSSFSFDYTLIVDCYLTPSARLVDRLPYLYGWVGSVHD